MRNAPQAVPLETLADRAVRLVGHDRTVGTQWAGYGTFRELLLAGLPEDMHLSDTPPYTVFDANRHINAAGLIAPQLPPPPATVTAPLSDARQELRSEPARPDAARDYAPARGYQLPADRFVQPERQIERQPEPRYSEPVRAEPVRAPAAAASPYGAQQAAQAPVRRNEALPPLAARAMDPGFQQRHSAQPQQQTSSGYAPLPPVTGQQPQAPLSQPEQRREAPRAPVAQGHQQVPAGPPQQRTADQATQIQQSIARIHEACQAPALAPAEYRVLFDVMAQELTNNGLQGTQTLTNITQRAREFGLDLKRDDLRFILEVVSESDPWFEQGASANLFASRFRNFVVARCRSQGLNLSADELDLVDAWFSSQGPQAARTASLGRPGQGVPQAPASQPQAQPAAQAPAATGTGGRDYTPQSDRWWSLEEGRQHIAEQRSPSGYGQPDQDDEFPRIVRSRLRG